jgi:hypothetical protein
LADSGLFAFSKTIVRSPPESSQPDYSATFNCIAKKSIAIPQNIPQTAIGNEGIKA